MSINLSMPEITELKPRITVFGVGGAGGNAVNNMITSGLNGVEFVVANTDAQALTMSSAERIIQMGVAVTEGLGAGSRPEVGAAAADEVIDEIRDQLAGSHMVFVTAGMGGGTGTGAAPVVANAAREQGILTVGVVTKPFQFEGQRRMHVAEAGIVELQRSVDTLIVIPNQNLFRVANEKTTFADAFAMADEVLYSGVACITDLMVKEGLINLDFADVRAVMREMGKAMMGTGEASGDKRATEAAEAAISNPLLDETSMRGAGGLLISITGGRDLTLFEVDEAASRIREEVDDEANIILGATFDESLEGVVRVSVVATGIDSIERAIAEKAAEAAPAAKPAPATNPAAAAPAAADIRPPVAAPHAVPQMPQARMAPPAQPTPQAATATLHGATTASHDGDVSIRRVAPAAQAGALAVAMDPPETAPEPHAEAEQEPFVPPVPERAERTPPRLPEVEDFPPIAQTVIKAERDGEVDDRRAGLLGRIAAGLGIKEPADDAAAADLPPTAGGHGEGHPADAGSWTESATPRAAQPMPSEMPVSPHERAEAPRAAQPQAAHPQTEENRPRLGIRPIDEDQLEIPAFLRRQAK